jgi:hypothetical protein
MARLVRGDRSHIDGAAQVWPEATAFRDGDPDVAPLEDSRPIIARVANRPRSVLIVALHDEDQVIAFAVAAPALAVTDDLAGTAEVEYVGVRREDGGLAWPAGCWNCYAPSWRRTASPERSYWSTSATGAQLACTNVSAGRPREAPSRIGAQANRSSGTGARSADEPRRQQDFPTVTTPPMPADVCTDTSQVRARPSPALAPQWPGRAVAPAPAACCAGPGRDPRS